MDKSIVFSRVINGYRYYTITVQLGLVSVQFKPFRFIGNVLCYNFLVPGLLTPEMPENGLFVSDNDRMAFEAGEIPSKFLDGFFEAVKSTKDIVAA